MRRMDDDPSICNELIQLGQRRNGRLNQRRDGRTSHRCTPSSMLRWWFHNMAAKTLGPESDFVCSCNTRGVHKSFDKAPLRGNMNVLPANVHHYQKSSLVYQHLEDIVLPYVLEILSSYPFMGKFLVHCRDLLILDEHYLGSYSLINTSFHLVGVIGLMILEEVLCTSTHPCTMKNKYMRRVCEVYFS